MCEVSSTKNKSCVFLTEIKIQKAIEDKTRFTFLECTISFYVTEQTEC